MLHVPSRFLLVPWNRAEGRRATWWGPSYRPLTSYPFQASFAPMEDKLNQAHLEVQQLKASVKNYEGMIDNYKSQVGLW